MNADGGRDRQAGDARVAGLSRPRLLRLPIRSDFCGPGKNQALLLPSASDCAVSGAIAKDRRRRLDEESLAQAQSLNRSFHLSEKDFRPNYPGHRCLRARADLLVWTRLLLGPKSLGDWVLWEERLAEPRLGYQNYPGHLLLQAQSAGSMGLSAGLRQYQTSLVLLSSARRLSELVALSWGLSSSGLA